jgi:predicted  nucleic acid-binding Zn-ribbon protein
MADEEIPENLDLRFIAVQSTRILRELGDMRGQMTEVRGQMIDMREQMTDMRGQMTEMRGQIIDVRGQMTDVREQMTEMRWHMTEMRGQTQHIPQIRADISALQIGQAVLSADLKIVKKDVEDLKETGRIVEGRLVRIERQLGYVKA